MTKPYTSYHDFLPSDLDVWPIIGSPICTLPKHNCVETDDRDIINHYQNSGAQQGWICFDSCSFPVWYDIVDKIYSCHKLESDKNFIKKNNPI